MSPSIPVNKLLSLPFLMSENRQKNVATEDIQLISFIHECTEWFHWVLLATGRLITNLIQGLSCFVSITYAPEVH